jgi:hypothetical protein
MRAQRNDAAPVASPHSAVHVVGRIRAAALVILRIVGILPILGGLVTAAATVYAWER